MRHLTYASVLLAAAALAACASGTREIRDTEVVRSPTVLSGTDGSTAQIETQREIVTSHAAVPLPVQQAYRRLHVVYDELGIEPRSFSDRDHFVGHQNLVLRRRLGNRRLSTFLNCGSGMTGPHADQYEVTMTIVSQLRPEGDTRSRVSTRIEATARPMGVSGSPVACTTTGQLESEIARRLGGEG